jgi:hypothetical protein
MIVLYLFLFLFLLLLIGKVRSLKNSSDSYIKAGNRFLAECILYSNTDDDFKKFLQNHGVFEFKIQKLDALKTDREKFKYFLKLRRFLFSFENKFTKHTKCYCISIPHDSPQTIVEKKRECAYICGDCKQCTWNE